MSSVRQPFNRQRAFTLIELLVVILIVGVLIAVAAPSFLGQQGKAHESGAKQTLALGYKAAKAASVDTEGQFIGGELTLAKLKAAIEQSEPQLAPVADNPDTDGADLSEGRLTVITGAGNTEGSTLKLAVKARTGRVCVLTVARTSGPAYSGCSAGSVSSPAPGGGGPIAPFTYTTISTVAGTGTASYGSDGGMATAAMLNYPFGVAVATDGSVLIADRYNHRVRRVAPGGAITTVAGNGTGGYGGDGSQATSAQLNYPAGVAVAPDGSVIIADTNNQRVRKVAPNGTIATIAGTGVASYGGDGGPATSAQLNGPSGVAVAPDGSVLIADAYNSRVRRVTSGGTITTFAGTGTGAFGGDGGAAASAAVNIPWGVAAAPDGSILIADAGNNRVRRVAPGGTITTVAGTGSAGYGGDGSAATSAQLNSPAGVAVSPDGSVLIADATNNRVRRIAPNGNISTVAGTGTAGYGGDGSAATSARVNNPYGVAAGPDGSVIIADRDNHRVRSIAAQ